MDEAENTRALLEKMTDAGRFERLATDALRAADPLYKSLSHPGVNADGKTVISPVDGITVAYDESGKTLILTAHSTTARKNLRGKWLSSDDNDWDKAYAIIEAERQRTSFDNAVVILTTNREPSEKLVRDVHAKATGDLVADIWTASRLTSFLDNDPEGQWIRSQFFGRPVQRVSASLLRELSDQSGRNFRPQFDPDMAVKRSVDDVLWSRVSSHAVTSFVIADSGLGKSVAVWRLAQRWNATGKFAFFLSQDTVEKYPTFAQALTSELKLLEPSLDDACGAAVIALCQKDASLLVIVEDANEAANPAKLIDRVLQWPANVSGKERGAFSAWRLMCPIWPSTAATVDIRLRDKIDEAALTIGPYERDETIEALRLKANAQARSPTDVQLNQIANALGDDPLLIALNQAWNQTSPASVFQSFVDHHLSALEGADHLLADLHAALTTLAQELVLRPNISPSWQEISLWFAEDEKLLRALRAILHQGKIIRLDKSRPDHTLAYRHDRVRDHLLVGALASLLREDRLPDEIWADPYFTDLLGSALTGFPSATIEKACSANPVSLFAALRQADMSSELRTALTDKATAWTKSDAFAEPGHLTQRHHAVELLAQIDGPFVQPLAQHFKDPSWSKLEALLRNGDAEAGVSLCYRFDPSLWHIWRDRIIEHAQLRHPDIINQVAQIISNPATSEERLAGALNFAGELGDAALVPALLEAWTRDPSVGRIGYPWIWAALMCFDGEDCTLLDSLCEVWASLSEKEDREPDSHPIWDLVGHSLPHAFARKPKEAAIDYLIRQSAVRPKLASPITSILERVDLPQAAVFIAQKMADIDHRCQEAGGFNIFASTSFRTWDKDNHGRQMSEASRTALRDIWQDKNQDRWLRLRSFGIWNQTLTGQDISDIRPLAADEVLADSALRVRLKNGDRSALPELRKHLMAVDEQSSRWWFSAREVGLDGLEDIVEATLCDRRDGKLKTYNDGSSDTDYILSEMLMDRRDAYAEATLIKHWDHLQKCPNYIQAALYIGSPALTKLAADIITSDPNPARCFEHLSMHWGVKTLGRPGIVDQSQLEAMLPYLPHLDWLCMSFLFEACNDLGLYAWRREHIDSLYFQFERSGDVGDEAGLFSALDRMVDQGGNYIGSLHFWLERRREEGHSPRYLLKVVADWASARGSIESLDVLASAVQEIGARSDLDLLKQDDLATGDAADAFIANSEYAVKRRSLH